MSQDVVRHLVASVLYVMTAWACESRSGAPRSDLLPTATGAPVTGGTLTESFVAAPDAAPPATVVRRRTSPLECLLSARSARVRVHSGTRECFGSSDAILDIELGAHTMLAARKWDDTTHQLSAGPLWQSAEQGRQILTDLVMAATREEIDDGTGTTIETFARISYQCDRKKHRPLMFETHRVGPTWGSSILPITPSWYSNALDVVAVADAASVDLPWRVALPGSDEVRQPSLVAGSLRADGGRVRHDPMEEWDDL
jgi:hypothetical protein